MSKALLIEILLDNTAREDERDDAAIQLRNYDGQDVINALIQTANNPKEGYMVRASCGESLAAIWLRNSQIDFEALEKLTEPAKSEAQGLIKAMGGRTF